MEGGRTLRWARRRDAGCVAHPGVGKVGRVRRAADEVKVEVAEWLLPSVAKMRGVCWAMMLSKMAGGVVIDAGRTKCWSVGRGYSV
jgi:hypothetical protein